MAASSDRDRILKKVASIFGPKSKSYIGESNVVSVQWSRYTIRFDARDPVIALQQLLTAIGRAEAKVAEFVGLAPKALTIEICRTERDLAARGNGGSAAPAWAGGAFDGTIRVLSDPQDEGTPHSLYVFLTHEFVHAALATHPGRPLPGWFEEGLAIFLSQNLPGDYRSALAAALKVKKTLPLSTLDPPLAALDQARVPLAYAQSASLVEFMMDRLRPLDVHTMVHRAKQRGFDAMLRSAGTTASLLEADWKRWAAGQMSAQGTH